jgi:transcriptional regulator of acetoin/glycerol metabolism
MTSEDKVDFDQPLRSFRQAWLDAGEREWLKHVLRRHDGCVAAAAAWAGVDRTHLHRLIRKHRSDLAGLTRSAPPPPMPAELPG